MPLTLAAKEVPQRRVCARTTTNETTTSGSPMGEMLPTEDLCERGAIVLSTTYAVCGRKAGNCPSPGESTGPGKSDII